MFRKISSERRIARLLMKNGFENLDQVIDRLKSSAEKTIELDGHRASLKQVLYVAQELKGKFHREWLVLD